MLETNKSKEGEEMRRNLKKITFAQPRCRMPEDKSKKLRSHKIVFMRQMRAVLP